MNTTTATPEVNWDHLRSAYDDFLNRARHYDTAESLKSAGEIVRLVIEDGHNSAPNVLAQLLEDLRAIYRERFGAPATPAMPVPESLTRMREAVAATTPAPSIDLTRILGTYTVVFPDGDYETIRLKAPKEGSPLHGKVIAEYLMGPDNTTEYAGFAFVQADGRVSVWSRFANLRGSRKQQAVETVVRGDDETRASGREAYAMRSGRCSRCGRVLTVPASLNRGMGPECAGLI